MPRTDVTRSKVLALGVGALLAPVVACGTADVEPDTRSAEEPATSSAAPAPPAPLPPATPPALTSELLARGAAGEFAVEEAGVDLRGEQPTDVAVVRATLAPQSSLPWHEHPGPSMVVVQSGTLRLVQPVHGGGHGCTEETFGPGTAFVHRAEAHAFANDRPEPVVFYITYFVPEGASPAPVPVDPPPGC
ncbi:hypothetical protein [Geodermatophilus sp. SYSU D00815]